MEEVREKEMTFLDHLEELRRHILRGVSAIIVGAVLGYIFGTRIISLLSKPVGELYFFSPPEAFLVRLKVAGAIGFVIAMPYLLFELWRFVAPGLTSKEKKYAFPLVTIGTFLFYIGGGFGFFVVLPLGIRVLMGFGGEHLIGLINASRYFNFVIVFLLVFGLLFELPVIMFFLVKMGIIEPSTLARRRREVIVGIFILAAVLTPSVDFITQLLLAIPLIILFEIGLLASRFGKK
jgi:sec-independent protein translocase protein TatC